MKPLACALIIFVLLSFRKQMPSDSITKEEFIEILNGVAKGWIDGNAEFSANFFADDAVYEEPPKQQFYRGKEKILSFFDGIMKGDVPLKMKWHNMAFNQEDQVGFGEYTFARLNQFHGIVVIKIKNGKIYKWREYQYKSELNWSDFTGESSFRTIE